MVSSIPTRILAGVKVPDTPLITKAIEYAKSVHDTPIFNHVMRSWLLSQVIGSNVPALQGGDVELLAICAIFHDLGWVLSNPALCSPDKRFEVDGANFTREFLLKEGKAKEWDRHRIQLAWDTVALNATASIAMYKEAEVATVMHGVTADFVGPVMSFGGVLTQEVFDRIAIEFPRKGLVDGVTNAACGLCRQKPDATYDGFVADFGEKYVEGYSRVGHVSQFSLF